MKRLTLIGLLLTGLAGLAPGQQAQEDQEDEPGRGVARVSLLNGDVSVKRGDSGDFVAAAINAPLVVQDQLITGTVARAELQMDFANYLRVGPNSDVKLTELENRRYMIQVGRGMVTWRVRRGSNADIDINTPSISVRPLRAGDYRVEVLNDGSTQITVRDGEAEIYSPKGVQRLREGRTMMVRGQLGDPEFQLTAEIPRDDWDRWNDRRDQDLERSVSRQYVSQDVLGTEELDAHGAWIDVAPYGRVWRPRVAVDWAPYRYGRWTWLDWYGWSWVSYDPFGWAPFHHGRWFWNTGGWCWYPGGVARNWWRPAIVSWFGYGGFGVSVGFNRWGWVPLAPFEPFRPWYGSRFYRGGRGGTFIDNSVRITNNYNIVNNYRNARVNGAVSSVEATHFGRNHRAQYDRVAEANLRSASLVQGQLPATPHRESLAYSSRESSVRSGGYEGAVFSRRQAANVERVPFENQRRGVEQVASRAFGNPEGGRRSLAESDTGRGSGVVDGGASREAARGSDGSRGWRRMSETPGVASGQRSAEPSRGAESRGPEFRGPETRGADSREANRESVRGSDAGGWRRFGEPGSSSRGESRGESRGAVRSGDASAESLRGGGDVGRGGADRSSGRDGWRRFGSPADGGSRGSDATVPDSRGSRSGRVYGATPENGVDRGGRSSGSNDRRYEGRESSRGDSGFRRRDSEGLQVNPPLIYDRSGDRTGDRSSGRSRSGDSGSGGFRGSFPSSSPNPGVDRSNGSGERTRGGFGGGRQQSSPPPSMEGGRGGSSRGGDFGGFSTPRGGGDSGSGMRGGGGSSRGGGENGRSGDAGGGRGGSRRN